VTADYRPQIQDFYVLSYSTHFWGDGMGQRAENRKEIERKSSYFGARRACLWRINEPFCIAAMVMYGNDQKLDMYVKRGQIVVVGNERPAL